MGRKQLIHFATHDSFPKNENYEDAKQNNPFYSCGLLLCAGGTKPALDDKFNYYKTGILLNPEKLVEANRDLKGTTLVSRHVLAAVQRKA